METVRQKLVNHVRAMDSGASQQFKTVEGAADITAIVEDAASLPALYAVRGASRSDAGTVIEEVRDTYLLVLAVSNVRGPRGEDSSDEAEILSNQVEAWLRDFEPLPHDVADREHRFVHLKRTGGRNMRWADQTLIWADTYEHKYARRCC